MTAAHLSTVLVANRGEIARRVIRTLRTLGIRSVAVYSDADVAAPHVHEADVAVRVGPAPAAQSYLSIDAIIDACRRTGAEAVHPGYGFLSENADFARACDDAGVVFIGPDTRALEVMGDKIQAKAHVARHGVPVVPGFSAIGLDDDAIAEAAAAIGYPVLVKPSAGGGGKGMQIVRRADDLREALHAARRIAGAAFADDALLVERLLERPRHIEVQILADASGNVIHLGERECTLQRRHQKVVEEAPSPAVNAATRERLGRAACAAAASVEYRGVGTVEFLLSADAPDDFFFIEMNTRLQVEHPVTELVTGIDLVAQQLRVAAGLPLEIAQDDVLLSGHAIEARVYAETPARGFVPSTGMILEWRPAPSVRVDSGIESGTVIGGDYDPMIAKLIALGADRSSALERLDAALAETVVLGVDTNIGFLRELIALDAVRLGELDTGIIDALPPFIDPEPSPRALAAAARLAGCAREADGSPEDASDLWRARTGWRGGAPAVPPTARLLTSSGEISTVPVDAGTPGAPVRAPEIVSGARNSWRPRRFLAPPVLPAPDGVVAAIAADGDVWVHDDGTTHRLQPLTRREAMQRRSAARARPAGTAAPEHRAPMPGAVVGVHVRDGERVRSGERLVTVEAMKMEHPITATHAGFVRVHVHVGDQVGRDQIVAIVNPDADSDADSAASDR